MVHHSLKIAAGPAMAVMMSGCATYAPATPAYAYFPASCSAPGAFPAMAIGAPANVAGQPAPSVPLPPGSGPNAVATSPGQPLGCLVAATLPRSAYGYGSYGGGYRYYDRYYGGYGYGGFGSIGIGFGGGRHWGGHGGHGGGHGHHGH